MSISGSVLSHFETTKQAILAIAKTSHLSDSEKKDRLETAFKQFNATDKVFDLYAELFISGMEDNDEAIMRFVLSDAKRKEEIKIDCAKRYYEKANETHFQSSSFENHLLLFRHLDNQHLNTAAILLELGWVPHHCISLIADKVMNKVITREQAIQLIKSYQLPFTQDDVKALVAIDHVEYLCDPEIVTEELLSSGINLLGHAVTLGCDNSARIILARLTVSRWDKKSYAPHSELKIAISKLNIGLVKLFLAYGADCDSNTLKQLDNLEEGSDKLRLQRYLTLYVEFKNHYKLTYTFQKLSQEDQIDLYRLFQTNETISARILKRLPSDIKEKISLSTVNKAQSESAASSSSSSHSSSSRQIEASSILSKRHLLIDAIRSTANSNLSKTEVLLRLIIAYTEYPDITSPDHTGKTPLLVAHETGNKVALQWLFTPELHSHQELKITVNEIDEILKSFHLSSEEIALININHFAPDSKYAELRYLCIYLDAYHVFKRALKNKNFFAALVAINLITYAPNNNLFDADLFPALVIEGVFHLASQIRHLTSPCHVVKNISIVLSATFVNKTLTPDQAITLVNDLIGMSQYTSMKMLAAEMDTPCQLRMIELDIFQKSVISQSKTSPQDYYRSAAREGLNKTILALLDGQFGLANPKDLDKYCVQMINEAMSHNQFSTLKILLSRVKSPCEVADISIDVVLDQYKKYENNINDRDRIKKYLLAYNQFATTNKPVTSADALRYFQALDDRDKDDFYQLLENKCFGAAVKKEWVQYPPLAAQPVSSEAEPKDLASAASATVVSMKTGPSFFAAAKIDEKVELAIHEQTFMLSVMRAQTNAGVSIDATSPEIKAAAQRYASVCFEVFRKEMDALGKKVEDTAFRINHKNLSK